MKRSRIQTRTPRERAARDATRAVLRNSKAAIDEVVRGTALDLEPVALPAPTRNTGRTAGAAVGTPVVVSVAPRQPGPAIDRAPTIASERYLEAVREMACALCGAPAPSDPHHYPPRSNRRRRNDLLTLPVCRPCHDRAQQNRVAGAVQAEGVHATQRLLFERRGALWWLAVARDIAEGIEA